MINKLLILYLSLKELVRPRQYRGLKRYERKLKKKEYLNGKEKFIMGGATAYLNRLQADRRAKSLGLAEYIPYDERNCKPDEHKQGDFLAWDRSITLFDC